MGIIDSEGRKELDGGRNLIDGGDPQGTAADPLSVGNVIQDPVGIAQAGRRVLHPSLPDHLPDQGGADGSALIIQLVDHFCIKTIMPGQFLQQHEVALSLPAEGKIGPCRHIGGMELL